MQLAGLIQNLKRYKKKNKLNDLRNKNGEIIACFLACDTMFPYIDEYFDNIPDKLFPKVKDL